MVPVHQDQLESASDAKPRIVFGTTLAVTISSVIGVSSEEAILVSESCTNGIATSKGCLLHIPLSRAQRWSEQLPSTGSGLVICWSWIIPSCDQNSFNIVLLISSYKSQLHSPRNFGSIVSQLSHSEFYSGLGEIWIHSKHRAQLKGRSRIQPPSLDKPTPSKDRLGDLSNIMHISTLHKPSMQTPNQLNLP